MGASMHKTSQPGRLGIIGGGQLGMYLCQAARSLGVKATVLMPRHQESASYEADAVIEADLDDTVALEQLIQDSDVITFEWEAIPDETLQVLQTAEERLEVRVHPGLEALRLLRDKGSQKDWLVKEGLPTLPYSVVTPGEGFSLAGVEPGTLPLVQKSCRGGYDGKGVQMIRSPGDLEKLWPVPSVLEPLLEKCREAAVIVARGSDGEIASYPVVSMEFDARFNAVASVTSPAVIPVELQETCEAVARRAVARLGAVGVFAVEFFIDEEARVYINEISPRVHNSGHLTMEAFASSQFEQHVRAVMGLPLAPVSRRSSAAVMLNILFDLTWENRCKTPQGKLQVEAGPDTRLHWYGKSRGTEGRKMGHVTALGPSASHAAAKARRALSECSLQEAQCR